MNQALWNPDRYRAAYRFAAEAHQGQTLPNSALPYLLHLGWVAGEVLYALGSEPEHDADLAVQCALLHDTIEDTAVTYAQIAEFFSPAVAEGVQALSKNPEMPKDQQIVDSLDRIQKQPSAIWLVKLADRIANLQPPPESWSLVKCQAYHADAQMILAKLGSASPVLAKRLSKAIDAYNVYLL